MIIRKNDTGAAVEDIQQKLINLGYMDESKVLGTLDEETIDALSSFCESCKVEFTGEVTNLVWSRLVDETFELGDRSLYLRVPYFHGNDVKTLQHALNTLGFSCGDEDGIFGPHTEDALRKYQLNLALPTDGIAGNITFRSLINLAHSWKDKESSLPIPHLGFARVAQVLDENLICLFGTTEFTRLVASRMSNLALATSPSSKVTSAESLMVEPDESTIFVQILGSTQPVPKDSAVVSFEPQEYLSLRIKQALQYGLKTNKRFAIRVPEQSWEHAGIERSAQHYAIVLLDALCAALSEKE